MGLNYSHAHIFDYIQLYSRCCTYLLDNAHANYLSYLSPSQWFTKCSIPFMALALIRLLPTFLLFIRLQNTPYPMPFMFPSSACKIGRPSSFGLGRPYSQPRTISTPLSAACEPPHGRPSLFGPRRGHPCFLPRTIPPPPPAAYNPVSLIRPPLPRGWPSSFAPRHSRPCSEASRPLTNPSRPAVLI